MPYSPKVIKVSKKMADKGKDEKKILLFVTAHQIAAFSKNIQYIQLGVVCHQV